MTSPKHPTIDHMAHPKASPHGCSDYIAVWTEVGDSNPPARPARRGYYSNLLDTGIWATELVNLRFRDVNLKNNSFEVRGKGRGGGKKRTVFFGKRTRTLLWKYLLPRLDALRDDDFVFVNHGQVGGEVVYRHMTRRGCTGWSPGQRL